MKAPSLKPGGHASVMAQHAPAAVEADTARQALHRKLEFFPTPPWAARAGGELIQLIDPAGIGGTQWAWEPACGEGHMAHGLGDYFERVLASDIHDHGWAGQMGAPLDFLSPAADAVDQVDWIVTNPPFGSAAEFVATGLRRARRGVAILARVSLMESAGRFGLFFGANPVAAYAPFIERVPMTLGGWDPKASTATAYAWFVWLQPHVFSLARGAHPAVIPIPPGTRARLTHPDDARVFGVRSEAPLFGEIGGHDG